MKRSIPLRTGMRAKVTGGRWIGQTVTIEHPEDPEFSTLYSLEGNIVVRIWPEKRLPSTQECPDCMEPRKRTVWKHHLVPVLFCSRREQRPVGA